jgi:hypothetical protein
LLLLTMPWSPQRWQTWVWRGLALLISLLAFPALEDLRSATQQEYTPRVLWIALIFAMAIGVSFLGWRWGKRLWLNKLTWLLILIISLLGAFMPTWVYWQVKSAFAPILGTSVGIGWGVWLNGVGQLFIASMSLRQLVRLNKK